MNIIIPHISEPKKGYKFCTGCKIEKPATLEFFYSVKNKHRKKTYLNPRCIPCMKEYNRKGKTTKFKWSDKEGHKYCRGTCGLERPVEDFRSHKGKPYHICRVCENQSVKDDPVRRATTSMRGKINRFLFSRSIKKHAELGCTQKEFKKWVEDQFLPGMTWRNYGEKWHLDHDYPLSKAIKLGIEVYAKACHYTNLKPMWAKDNIKKHAKIPEKFKNVDDFLNFDPKATKTSFWD